MAWQAFYEDDLQQDRVPIGPVYSTVDQAKEEAWKDRAVRGLSSVKIQRHEWRVEGGCHVLRLMPGSRYWVCEVPIQEPPIQRP